MVNLLTNLYSIRPRNDKDVSNNNRIYSLIRFSIRNFANFTLPFYYKFSNLLVKNELFKNNKQDVIVSLTSFPPRINKVWIVIESILRQSHKPDKIILWLSKDQFPTKEELPVNLLKLEKRGLEIFLCEGDLKSHKKYYYMLKYYPESTFIIIDDDTLYPTNLLKKLLEYRQKYPKTVCFNRGYQVKIKDGNVLPYKEWEKLSNETFPRSDIMPTGVGGVLYPPGIFYKDVSDSSLFFKLCENADDIWLYSMVLLNKKKLIKTNEDRLFIPIIISNNSKLTSINVKGGLNDRQLNNIKRYYKKWYNIEVFGTL